MADPKLSYFMEKDGNTFFVAEDPKTKQIVGCVGITKIPNQDRMEIHRLIVRSDYRVINL